MRRPAKSWHVRTDLGAVMDWITAGFGGTYSATTGDYTRYAYWELVPGGRAEWPSGTGVTWRLWAEMVHVVPTPTGMPSTDWLSSRLRGAETLRSLAGIVCVTHSGQVARVTLTDPSIWDAGDPYSVSDHRTDVSWTSTEDLVTLLFG